MADPADFSTERALAFGSFRLLPSRRLLFDGETPVRLGSRALEILIALIERRGELAGKDELINRVWPSTHIFEGNLKLQVAGVRRALGDGRDGRRYIETSPGQGYRFVAPVTVINDAASAGQALPILTSKQNLPVQLTRLIGRGGVVSKLVEQFSAVRLLTIVPYAVPRTEACEKEGSLNFRHLDTGYGKMHAPDVRASPLFRDATVPILLPKTGRMVTEVRS